MELIKATDEDFHFLSSWLADEEKAYQRLRDNDQYGDFDRGFWCNLSVIERNFERGELEVVRIGGKAVAFHFGQFLSPGITEVHPLYRGQGLGTAIVRQVLARASSLRVCECASVRVCRLHVSCITQRSVQFWERFGFYPRDADADDRYKILDHPIKLPLEARPVVQVEFFGEGAWYTQGSGGRPYKMVDLPCVLVGDRILLGAMCHDATADRDSPRGDRHVRVTLDGETIFHDWIGTSSSKAFGFGRNPHCYTTCADSFDLSTLTIE
ncbi:GNAT family N-acetyltransferase [Agrobacterium sp. DSM 25558]|uniref:GNAT family N-acetyltransferase n=1 Tax=Agrobacterium sp. DSM 25558 TaxID=1907665 RepID=UPI0013563811|nr:GNAT family N-acetyltransferase [Agrobacterium sp. DSM 25558]